MSLVVRRVVPVLAFVACGGSNDPPPRLVDVEPPTRASSSASPDSAPAPAPSVTATATPSATPSAAPSAAPSASPSASSTAKPGAACIEDARAKTACAAKGKAFRYGPRPYIRCSGVAPRPGEEEAAHATIRNAPCECFDVAAVNARARECMTVPSAPPGPH